jgi:hypothetical protein
MLLGVPGDSSPLSVRSTKEPAATTTLLRKPVQQLSELHRLSAYSVDSNGIRPAACRANRLRENPQVPPLRVCHEHLKTQSEKGPILEQEPAAPSRDGGDSSSFYWSNEGPCH